MWQVVVDFDGTISLEDTTDLLLERFAAPEWREIEADWVAGKIGSRECMIRQIDLVQATPEQMADFIDHIEIDRNFLGFVKVCERFGLPVVIASDGLDLIINAVLKKAGLGHLPVVANHLSHVDGSHWCMTSPNARGGCDALSGTCKCAVVRERKKTLTLVIGDGRSDRCAASEADFVFAKSGLIKFCEEQGLAFQSFQNFAEATSLLAALIYTSPQEEKRLLALKSMING